MLILSDRVLSGIIIFSKLIVMKLPRTPKPLAELFVDHRDRLDKVFGQRVGPTG